MVEDLAPSTPRGAEIRVGVRCPATPTEEPSLAVILTDALPGWTAAPLFADADGIWLVSGPVAERVGTPEYARRAHSLAQELIDSGHVEHAEADVPLNVSSASGKDGDRSVLGLSDCPPGSE